MDQNMQPPAARTRVHAQSKALDLLGATADEVMTADQNRLPSTPGHRKRKSEVEQLFADMALMGSPTTRRRLEQSVYSFDKAQTPGAPRGMGKALKILGVEAHEVKQSLPPSSVMLTPNKIRHFKRMSDITSPPSTPVTAASAAAAAGGVCAMDTETISPTTRKAVKSMDKFKSVVESTLSTRGYHTRTRSGSNDHYLLTNSRGRVMKRLPIDGNKSVDFDSFLKDQLGFQHFLQFLNSEYSQENLLFWKAVEEYRCGPTLGRAIDLFHTFIKPGSASEVNIPHSVRNPIESTMKPHLERLDAAHHAPAEPSLFDDAQREIKRLMHRDSLSRFKQSKLWDQFAQECQRQLEFIQEDGDEQQ